MYKTQADAVKDWLQAYQNSEQHIDHQLEKLRSLKARMTSVGAQQLSDMPRPPSSPKDRLAEYVIKVEALEASIDRETKQLEVCRQTILDLTAQLEKAEACKLIRYRYLYGYEWGDVMYELYKDEKDLMEKQGTYKRRMYRLHETALKELSRIWTKPRDL